MAIEDSFCRAEGWLVASDASPSQKAIHIEQLLQLSEGLAKLSDEQRDAVVLHYLQGWSLAQLAGHLQRSEASIAGLLRRGLKKLRELMEERGEP
jgi:RNA polymerase sigma-70 factor (ECF subfamily)